MIAGGPFQIFGRFTKFAKRVNRPKEPRRRVTFATPTSALVCSVVALAASSCMTSKRAANFDTARIDWDAERAMHIPGFQRATELEAIRQTYSREKAASFLDDVAVRWTDHNHCGSCHTNIAYLMVQPQQTGGIVNPSVVAVRSGLFKFAEATREGSSELKPFLLAPIAGALAVNDGISGSTVDNRVLALMDYLWKTQDKRGGWYYSTNEPLVPFLERNRYYTSLLVAVGAGYLSGRYEETPLRREGLTRLTKFLKRNFPKNLHERAVLMWASARTPGLLSSGQRRSIARALLRAQNEDGGWTLAALGTWPRLDGDLNDPHGPSDGYATGLAALALCEGGSARSDPRILRAMQWIDTHQRVSGRWFTRSTYSDHFDNYISNMATAYAMKARQSCIGPSP